MSLKESFCGFVDIDCEDFYELDDDSESKENSESKDQSFGGRKSIVAIKRFGIEWSSFFGHFKIAAGILGKIVFIIDTDLINSVEKYRFDFVTCDLQIYDIILWRI